LTGRKCCSARHAAAAVSKKAALFGTIAATAPPSCTPSETNTLANRAARSPNAP
jgi:hypothetical protein